MGRKLFKPKLGREWAILWSKQEKKELIDYLIQECKQKEHYIELFKNNTMSVATFLRGGHKINKN